MRNVVKRDGAVSKRDGLDIATERVVVGAPSRGPAREAHAGGAGGDPGTLDPNPALTTIRGIQQVAPAPEQHEDSNEQPPRWFRVVGVAGPTDFMTGRGISWAMVMWEGSLTRILVGKTYPENAVDLDFLRKQGIKFEEVEQSAQTA
jgi:hypothetical protein